MVLPEETIQTGGSDKCDCGGVTLKIRILRSQAGYYIGTQCDTACGPWSRESGYYETEEKAAKALTTGSFGRV
jgi:hypothetical protein